MSRARQRAPAQTEKQQRGGAPGKPVLKRLFYRYEEAAELLHLSMYSIRALIDEGKLDRLYLGPHSPRITGESILSFIERRKHRTGSVAQAT